MCTVHPSGTTRFLDETSQGHSGCPTEPGESVKGSINRSVISTLGNRPRLCTSQRRHISAAPGSLGASGFHLRVHSTGYQHAMHGGPWAGEHDTSPRDEGPVTSWHTFLAVLASLEELQPTNKHDRPGTSFRDDLTKAAVFSLDSQHGNRLDVSLKPGDTTTKMLAPAISVFIPFSWSFGLPMATLISAHF